MQAQSKTLYFRRKNKITYSYLFKKEISLDALKLLLARKQGINIDHLLLLHKGKPIQQAFHFDKFNHKSIIHILDRQQIQQESISVGIRYNNTVSKWQIDTGTKIKDFLNGQFRTKHRNVCNNIVLIYVGKVMNMNRSFYEQHVERDCQLIMVNIEEYKRSKLIETIQNDLQNVIKEIQRCKDAMYPNIVKTQSEELNGGPNLKVDQSVLMDNSSEKRSLIDKRQSEILQNHLKGSSSRLDNKGEENKADNQQDLFQSKSLTIYQLDSPAQIKLSIKISQVHSTYSQCGKSNEVVYNQHDNTAIRSEQRGNQSIKHQQLLQIEQKQAGLNSSDAKKDDQIEKESDRRLRLNDLQVKVGDMFFIGDQHVSQTNHYIDNIVNQYKQLFES